MSSFACNLFLNIFLLRVSELIKGKDIILQVDGNITLENAKKCAEHGASMAVLGTSVVFKPDVDFEVETKKFREYMG